MIDRHGIARSVAIAIAVTVPMWLLRDAARQPPAKGPTIALTDAPATPLPDDALFAPSPITGETAGPTGAPQLVGIVGRLPDDAVALLRLADNTTHSVARGGIADGWTLAAIGADRVRLAKAGREHVDILPPVSADQ